MPTRLLCALAGAALLVPPSLSAAGAAVPEPRPEALAPAVAAAAGTVDAFHAALRRGDTAAALALLAEEALIFEEGRAERSKAEYAAHHLGADSEFSKAVPGEALRRRGEAAGDMAWIATEGRSKGRYRDTDVNRVTDETMVLRRDGAAWKIVHIHWSSAQSSVE